MNPFGTHRFHEGCSPIEFYPGIQPAIPNSSLLQRRPAPAARIRVVGEFCVANASERGVRQSQNYQQEAEEGGDRADSIGFIEASEEGLLASVQNGMFSIALPSRATPLDCSFLSRVRCQIREKIW
jgi:hypothetical protein